MRRGEVEPQSFRCFVELATCLSLFSNVACDFGSADDPSVGTVDRRYGQRNVAPRAILAHAHGLVVFDAFAGAQTSEDARLLIEVVRRNDDRDRLTDCFFGGEAKDAFCPRVPTRDDAFERLADDGVVSGLDQRCQPILREFRSFEVSSIHRRTDRFGVSGFSRHTCANSVPVSEEMRLGDSGAERDYSNSTQFGHPPKKRGSALIWRTHGLAPTRIVRRPPGKNV